MNLDYLAGIVDGEGTIGVYPYRTKRGGEGFIPYISVANTDKNLLEAIISFLHGIGIVASFSTKPPRKSTHKISYAIQVRCSHALKLACLLDGRLIVKTKQCQILAFDYEGCTPKNGQYTKESKAAKAELIERIHFLNLRGA